MLTGVLSGVHPRARGGVAEDAAGVQTGDVADRSSCPDLTMQPWRNRAGVDLAMFIFNFLSYLLSVSFEL